ncbi:hypothetical protein Pse7429DRAFT_0658 [Pseudanabaena biceps PCC 7429]|uniref:Uncharacterized protein n=1 Tax=Pseudanabaena biceps PCC 7429 TaxID=927668 RepID=L8N3C2_9CYAN|nr:hypothetical protein Pse7429DRAFT_0658 [Pseudanabaena biceps PCC 7429]
MQSVTTNWFPSPCGVKKLKPLHQNRRVRLLKVSVPLRGKKIETSVQVDTTKISIVSVPLRGKKIETQEAA